MKRLAQGIDVSHWQDGPDEDGDGRPDSDLIDRDLLLAHPPDFFIWRVGDGQDLDREAWHHMDVALALELAHGTPWGVYHYLRGRRSIGLHTDVLDEALDGVRPPLGVWLDIEGDPDAESRRHRGSYLDSSPEEVLSLALNYEATLAARGYPVGVYGNWGLRELPKGQRLDRLARLPLWIPDYAADDGEPGEERRTKWGPRTPGLPHPWAEWTIHQITGRGSWAGVGTAVDINVWNGDALDLAAWVTRHGPSCEDLSTEDLTPAQRLEDLERRVSALEAKQ
jgi:GH25 family lysozyme M1 (1,4-beta-N-acetylmuramidase)